MLKASPAVKSYLQVKGLCNYLNTVSAGAELTPRSSSQPLPVILRTFVLLTCSYGLSRVMTLLSVLLGLWLLSGDQVPGTSPEAELI